MTSPRRRVFIGFANTASYYSTLAKGFEELGHEVEYAALNEKHLTLRDFEGAQHSWLARRFHIVQRRRSETGDTSRLHRLEENIIIWLYFFVCAWRCDIFIFGSGKSFDPQFRDLKVLRWLGRKTLFPFLGSASRPPYLNGVYTNSTPPTSLNSAFKRSRAIHERLGKIAKLATAIIDSPTCGQLHQAPFINYFQIGFPNALEQTEAPGEGPAGGPTRIVHAPSKAAFKGTPHVEKVIQELAAEGHDIEFIRLQNLPNAKVLEALANCDFVIDQCYSDTPLAGFAGEAAAFSKPAVVGGYAKPEILRFGPYPDLPFDLFVPPHEMKDAVRNLIVDPAMRQNLGKKARRFVNEEWSANAVAKRYLQVADGVHPSTWWVNPAQIDYWQGAGAPEAVTKDFVAGYIGKYKDKATRMIASDSLRKKLTDMATRGED